MCGERRAGHGRGAAFLSWTTARPTAWIRIAWNRCCAASRSGCREAGAALLGGETAELPNTYVDDGLELVGFCVGVAEKGRLLDGSGVGEGDLLLGLSSSGPHSNGYSLVRRIVEKGRRCAGPGRQPDRRTVRAHPDLRPVRIAAGAVGAVESDRPYHRRRPAGERRTHRSGRPCGQDRHRRLGPGRRSSTG